MFKFTKAKFLNNCSGTILLCTTVSRPNTYNNRKIANFTYSCFYAWPGKVVSVDNVTRNNQFYYQDKFFRTKILEIAKEHLSNS